MRTAIATLVGVSPYCQSRYHDTPKLNKENPDDHEKRTWRNRLHTDENGMVMMPALAPRNCIADAAQYLSVKIPGGGQAKYTKHFNAGILVLDDIPLGVHKDNVIPNWVHVPSNGVRGNGKRVMKCYPMIIDWRAVVEFHILDDVITEPVFEYHLRQAGSLIGLGTFRVHNRGTCGRFKVEAITWTEGDLVL